MNNYHPLLVENGIGLAWRDATSPGHNEIIASSVGVEYEPCTYDKVKDLYGEKAADAWQEAVNLRIEFFQSAKEHVVTEREKANGDS